MQSYIRPVAGVRSPSGLYGSRQRVPIYLMASSAKTVLGFDPLRSDLCRHKECHLRNPIVCTYHVGRVCRSFSPAHWLMLRWPVDKLTRSPPWPTPPVRSCWPGPPSPDSHDRAPVIAPTRTVSHLSRPLPTTYRTQHRPRTMHQQTTHIPIAALADPQQVDLAAGRMLARHQSQISRQLPTIAERRPVTHYRTEHRGRQPTYTGYRNQTLTERISLMPDLQ